MTRSLSVVPGVDGAVVLEALRHSLSGDGPAILPHAGHPEGLPATVGQRVALVVETSGSTGRPKRVALSADSVLASAAASDSALGGPGQWLLALPATYIAGLNVIVRSLVAETPLVITRPGHFTAESFIEASRQLTEPRRFTSLVPAQLSRLLESDAAITELRTFARILVGGQATPATLVARCDELGIRVTRTYGSSETSGGCVYDGSPIGTTEMRVVDGEVQLGGPVLAEGYLDDPARTEAAFVVEDGRRWYRTGDAGAITDGVLRISGRLDDVIISGGLKVSLGEVESVVREQPGYSSAVVVRAASEEWGEVPVIVRENGAVSDLDSVRSAVVERLGKAARPAGIVVIERMPLTATGKPDRLALAADIAAGSRPVADR